MHKCGHTVLTIPDEPDLWEKPASLLRLANKGPCDPVSSTIIQTERLASVEGVVLWGDTSHSKSCKFSACGGQR